MLKNEDGLCGMKRRKSYAAGDLGDLKDPDLIN